MQADHCALSSICEMLPHFCCIAAAVQHNGALLCSGVGQAEKKLDAPRSGCLLIRAASNVSPTAIHSSSEYSNFGERGIDASDQFLLGFSSSPKFWLMSVRVPGFKLQLSFQEGKS